MLLKYDLPDLVAAFAPGPVWLVNLKSPVGQLAMLSEVRRAYSSSQRVYERLGSGSVLAIRGRRELQTVAETYPELR